MGGWTKNGVNQDSLRLRSGYGMRGWTRIICSLKDLQTPRGGDIFVEKCTVYRRTPERGEIFFYKSHLPAQNNKK